MNAFFRDPKSMEEMLMSMHGFASRGQEKQTNVKLSFLVTQSMLIKKKFTLVFLALKRVIA